MKIGNTYIDFFVVLVIIMGLIALGTIISEALVKIFGCG